LSDRLDHCIVLILSHHELEAPCHEEKESAPDLPRVERELLIKTKQQIPVELKESKDNQNFFLPKERDAEVTSPVRLYFLDDTLILKHQSALIMLILIARILMAVVMRFSLNFEKVIPLFLFLQ